MFCKRNIKLFTYLFIFVKENIKIYLVKNTYTEKRVYNNNQA